MNKFKERLKELRKDKSWSQDFLGQKIGVTHHSIYSWETGRAEPSIDYIIALSKAFEISADYLLGIKDEY